MKQNPTAIIVFMKNPVPGKVKTRLAKTIGSAAATEVYQLLLQKTRQELMETQADVFVYYYPHLVTKDEWNALPYLYKKKQPEGDLGQKMQHAFEEVLDLGYEKAIIIGTDCYELTARHLKTAITLLENADVVWGPSNDGGYYLLGMKKLIPAFFHEKPWSTSEVLSLSLSDCEKLQLHHTLLPILTDIDTYEDLQQFPELLHTIENNIDL